MPLVVGGAAVVICGAGELFGWLEGVHLEREDERREFLADSEKELMT